MDEVKTGFRVTLGGAQKYYNVKPDFTALRKIISAGFPVGIVGGRADIMAMAAPQSSDILDNSNTKSSASVSCFYLCPFRSPISKLRRKSSYGTARGSENDNRS